MNEVHIFKAFSFFMKFNYNRPVVYSEKETTLCIKFIALLKKEYGQIERLGSDFLWNYFIYQFDYWSTYEAHHNHKKQVVLTFIVGPKAFKRYLDRDIDYDWALLQKRRNYDQKLFENHVSLRTEKKEEISEVFVDIDEPYRRRFLNQEKGLDYCLTYTLLYHPRSQCCQQCQFVENCQMSQEVMYPVIYRDRVIDGSKTTTGQ